MKAVILAAGYATRLYPLTLETPKCLLTVGGATILDRLCDKLNAIQEVDEIIVVTNAKFFARLEEWNRRASTRAPIRVLNDGTQSNETRLGAIGDLDFVMQNTGILSDVLLLASDNLFEEGLVRFARFAGERPEAVSIALYDIGDPRLAAGKFGVHEINEKGEVIGMEEKPEHPRSSLIGMGVYFFPKDSLKYVPQYLDQKDAKDAPGFYIQWLFQRVKIYGFLFSGLWYDIGDLQALQQAKSYFGRTTA